MTFSELEQLQPLRQLIEHERGRLYKLRAAAGIKSPSLTGMPRGNGVHDRIGENIPGAVDLEAEILQQLAELEERKKRIEDWLREQPLKIRLIVTLRYVEGRTWNETAMEFYKDSWDPKSEAAVRMYLKRHLQAEEKRKNCAC